ncbi:metal ABC transporter ATP-binding protein [Peptococcus simiae]|uniref:metal ABC transporter ATP-binding protein n=1 Tax=Peptococcus simiae TaxID=1643805 RepID=UPI00398004D2
MAAIKCQDLTIAYGPVPVVQHMTFDLPTGAYLVIIGENGSGKSSLLKGLAGLVPLAAGSITFSPPETKPGYLAQLDQIASNFPASVQEVVLTGCLKGQHRPFYTAADKAAAQAALAKMDMVPFAGRSFQALSGGQRRRVLLARALVAADGLLFLDEPTAGLDTGTAADLYGLLRRLNRQEGLTIVTISHDMTDGLTDASHILHMDHGQLVYFGPAADYPGQAGKELV